MVEINTHSTPPICKILNYGRFLYNKKKKNKKNKIINIKEIKFRPSTNINDFNIKIKNIKRLLKKGNKIKIIMRFKGREIIHKNIALNMLNKIKEKLLNISQLIFFSKKTENRQIIMILNPQKK